MADQITVPVKEEEKPVEIPEDLKEYQDLHNKSLQQIMLDEQRAAREEENKAIDTANPIDTDNVNRDEPKEEKPTPPVEEAKEEPKVDVEAITKKAVEEALATARAEEAKRLEETKQKEEEAKQKELLKDDLVPAWVKEERQPASYEEIAAESKRIAKLETLAEIDAREAQRTQQAEAQRKQEEERANSVQKQQEEFNKQLQSEMDLDLNDLYSGNKLPKIADANNPNDEGILARNALFQAGIQVNQERATKGLPPIRSIKLIYYEHYKAPGQQPAGANAPVMGNAAPPANPNPSDDEYNWARDHNKSPRQLLRELQTRSKSGAN